MKLDDTENLEEMARLFANGNTRELELEGFEEVPDYYEEVPGKAKPEEFEEDSEFFDDDEYEDIPVDDEVVREVVKEVSQEIPQEPIEEEIDEDDYEEDEDDYEEDLPETEEYIEYSDYTEVPAVTGTIDAAEVNRCSEVDYREVDYKEVSDDDDYDYDVDEEEINEVVEKDEGISDEEFVEEDEVEEDSEEPLYEEVDIRTEIDEMDDDDEPSGAGIFAKILLAVGAVAIIALAVITSWFLYSKGIIFKKDTPVPDVVAEETVVDDTVVGDTEPEVAEPEPAEEIPAAEPVEEPTVEEEESKDYEEAEYENSVEIGLEVVSVLKDLKVKFVNTGTGKLIANIPFEVEVSFPDGTSAVWSDTDKDGIIYKDGLSKGSYTLKAKELTDEKYASYKMPASKVAEVKEEISYKAINVADEVLDSSQVDENAEDTARNGADSGGQTEVVTATEELKDTVTYVDSSQTVYYEQIDKSQVVYTGTVPTASLIVMPMTDVNTATGSVALNKSYTEIIKGKSEEILMTLTDMDAWAVSATSSDEKIATVILSADRITITGVDVGTATVTVAVNDKPEISAKIDVKVMAEASEGGTTDNNGSTDSGGTNGDTTTDTSNVKMKFTDGNQVFVLENDQYREAVNADYNNFTIFYCQKVKYTGWQTFDGNKYFYNSEGTVVTGDQVISGVKYSFDSTGKLVSEGGGQTNVTGNGTLGIDVSKWNGTIDWQKVKNAGVSYAIIRVGYRGSSKGSLVDDSMFKTNISGATAAGIKVGVYFFSQAVNEVEAVEEASMVIDRLSGYSLSLPVYLDVEKSGGRGDTIDKDTRTAVCKAFCQTVSNAGYKAGVYSNKNWLTEKLNASQLSGYSIWVAHYADACGYTGSYSMWQYTDHGSVDGISGNVDLDRLY